LVNSGGWFRRGKKVALVFRCHGKRAASFVVAAVGHGAFCLCHGCGIFTVQL